MDIETPWGKAQTIDRVTDGILIVSTASHGGILLTPERLATMPNDMRRPLYLERYAPFEEDCDWCMPVLVFEAEFRAFYTKEGIKMADEIFSAAKQTLKHWHPDIYEAFYSVTLGPGESRQRDEQIFYAKNKNSWLTVAASGDWKDHVPKGMIEVRARLGGFMNKDTSRDRFFLVPEPTYTAHRDPFAFKIDPDRYQEISRLP